MTAPRRVRRLAAPSIRRRVAVTVAVVVVLASVVSGAAAVLALDAYLRHRTDDQLFAARTSLLGAMDGVHPLREDVLRRGIGVLAGRGAVHLMEEGATIATVAFDDAVIPAPSAGEAARLGEPGDLTAGGVAYRGLAVPTPGLKVRLMDGAIEPVDTVVLARDVADDRATVRRVVQIEAVTGGAIAAVALVFTWWAVGAELRPLSRMARAARRVADGEDLRMPPGRMAETRDLAAALDAALDGRAEAEARLRDFVADAAHELRTPLTSVHGWAELYQQGVLDGAALDRAMERVEAESTRMRHLVDQLALLARLDAEVALDRSPVDLTGVVDAVLADLEVLAPDRAVRWSPPGPVVVPGDRERLVQVVQNLVGNVLRHTRGGLEVTLDAAPGAVVLTVRDEGPGLPPELAGRAFERFTRGRMGGGDDAAAAGAGRLREGSGLGLAIVAAVVAAHGGTVAIDTGPERGTAVTVRLPTA